jgi:type I restriction enzyme S subunit
VGACALVKETPPRLMLCDKIFRAVWRPRSPVLPAYLDEVIKTPHLRQQIEASLTGTSPTMKNISKPALLALRQQASQLREQARRQIEAALLGQDCAAPAA